MNQTLSVLLALLSLFSASSYASSSSLSPPPSFKKVFVVVFENTNYKDALNQPNFKKIASEGALLTGFMAEEHPSQGNYIALVSGDSFNIKSDRPVNLDVRHLGDLLEAKGLNWKVYLEGYPGNCFTGTSTGRYVRKHNPFISFKNIQSDSARCNAHLVNANQLQADIQANRVPEFSLYIPDLDNDGHDTGSAYADSWLGKTLVPLFKNPVFMRDLLFVPTFDENDGLGANQIYTALYGDSVIPGSTSSTRYSHYDLLKTIEDTLGLGDLGRKDAKASSITGVWK